MRARSGAAFAFVILALALGASACGGKSATTTTTTATQHAAASHWRAGLLRWKDSMAGALDSISIVFSTQSRLGAILTAGTRDHEALVRDERALAACTTTIGRLGPAPAGLALARRYALRACSNLERGEKLVEAAVQELRTSNPLDPLDAASGPLSTGESEMKSAALVLDAGSE